MITGINESKLLAKDISCKFKWKFDEKNVIQINGGITINVDASVKKIHVCEKDYVWNPATWNSENGKYLSSIKDDSVIICHEIIESYGNKIKTIPTNFNEKKITSKTQSFCILLEFLLITIALLVAVSIYCYQIKYRAKSLLPFHDTKLKQLCSVLIV